MRVANVHVNGSRTIMANDAVHVQLPIMVRRPKRVWPGLNRMDMHRKQIAGDGNCLFASLSDQLYGSPDKHLEIRLAVIDHMRTYRPLFESFTIKDDIQQKRATRAATNAIKNAVSDDAFEDYLAVMCKPGTYGGEPELMAFVQCHDQDVSVHLPYMPNCPESWTYVNEHRAVGVEVKPQLHLCYGGDEIAHAHYDSARKNSPDLKDLPLAERPKGTMTTTTPDPDSTGNTNTKQPTPRAIRSGKLDLSRDLMHDMIVKGSKDLRGSFDDSDRARSPSVSSSHHSSSSKRSFDDDGEPQRATKRADRRKSTRSSAISKNIPTAQTSNLKIKFRTNSRHSTPQSSTQTSDESEQSERDGDAEFLVSQEPETGFSSPQEVSPFQSQREADSEMRRNSTTEETTPAIINGRQQSAVRA